MDEEVLRKWLRERIDEADAKEKAAANTAEALGWISKQNAYERVLIRLDQKWGGKRKKKVFSVRSRVSATFSLMCLNIGQASSGVGISCHIHHKELFDILHREELKLLRHIDGEKPLSEAQRKAFDNLVSVEWRQMWLICPRRNTLDSLVRLKLAEERYFMGHYEYRLTGLEVTV